LGQKVNPIGLRVGVTKDWRSRWYADKRTFGALLHEDIRIRDMVKRRLRDAAISRVQIERYANRCRITVYSARPGIVIGRKGQDIDSLREKISQLTGKEIYVEIKEVKNPDVNAQLIAESIAMQMERRVSFRRAMKRALQLARELGALGIRIACSGRLGGAELARREQYLEGMVPLHTLRANVEYGFAEGQTTAGLIGVKVWVCTKPEKEEERTNASYA